jgi:hypothetical protein
MLLRWTGQPDAGPAQEAAPVREKKTENGASSDCAAYVLDSGVREDCDEDQAQQYVIVSAGGVMRREKTAHLIKPLLAWEKHHERHIV